MATVTKGMNNITIFLYEKETYKQLPKIKFDTAILFSEQE